MGAVWPRAVAPMGSFSRPQARKLTMLWSFIVATAILRSTFLATYCEYATTMLRTIGLFLHAPLAYHERGAIVKQARLRLSADVLMPPPAFFDRHRRSGFGTIPPNSLRTRSRLSADVR